MHSNTATYRFTRPKIIMRLSAVLITFLLSVIGFCSVQSSYAQTQIEIEQAAKKISPEEESRLKAIIEAPMPRFLSDIELRTLFSKKLTASRTLNDLVSEERLLKEAFTATKDALYLAGRGHVLRKLGKNEEGIALIQEAAGKLNSFNAAVALADVACGRMYDNNSIDKTEAAFYEAETKLVQAKRNAYQSREKRQVFSAESILLACKSLKAQRSGKSLEAITFAENAESFARKALEQAVDIKESFPSSYLTAVEGVAYRLRRRFEANVAAEKIYGAEIALIDYLKFVNNQQLDSRFKLLVYSQASHLRELQRRFDESLKMALAAEAVNLEAKNTPFDSQSLSIFGRKIWALIGLNRHQEALQELARLDTLAGDDKTLQSRIRSGWMRGNVYVNVGKYEQAAKLFKDTVSGARKTYTESHFHVAQPKGMEGVALWRMGTVDSKSAALELLKASVQDFTLPSNAEFLDNLGARKERRELIFSTYLEAIATTPSEDAVGALGLADWSRGGLVQEALSDSALRSAAASPALQALVRSEQDARNEIRGLRSYLAGEAGGAASPLPAIAAQMRERISALETQRTAWQGKIKASFPDYERLVRPTPPSVADITAQLGADEALLVVQPTERATYVWALAKDRPGAFARVDVGEAQVADWVKALRASLDVAALPPGRRPPFAHSAAQQLYAQLVAPVQAVLQGKPQLIVAAGGALGQIPFAVLQTHSGANSTTPLANAPWLVKQTAISHVPSVAAWLAMRTSAATQRRSAEQPLMAWGDPVFNLKSHLQNTPNNTKISDVDTGKLATQSIVAKDSQGNDTTVRQVSLTRANTVVDLETEDPRSALRYSDIPALPETRSELLAIAKELGANPATDLLLGTSATRQSVLAANASGLLGQKRVIAFATHGLMAGDLPNLTQPALALAASSTDGTATLAPLLLLEDVLGLKLNADWVVLSACNTAAADGKAEEALSGLARGFFYAGGRSLLVTHWAVESDSATQITTETFKHYAANPTAPKAESLRQAMLKLINSPQTSHPALWAPYALVGDGAR
jgi:CHAT domain-containing protein